MNIAILSIGNELLSGFTINTNASWIGKKLTNIGCSINNQITIKDNKNLILNALRELCNNEVHFLIITGGLGPTNDDMTRNALFKFVSTPETFDENYWRFLKEKYKKLNIDLPDSNKSQAIIPTKGKLIPNPIGSARGFQFKYKNTEIISLPGVPSEMKLMMSESIIPKIKNNISIPKFVKSISTYGIVESMLVEKIKIITNQFLDCEIGYYPSIMGVDIRISGYDLRRLNQIIRDLKNNLKEFIYSSKNELMEEVVVRLAIKKKKTIAIAESCTGGLISDRITNVSGSSNIFKGSIISYSNESKVKLLNINKNILDKRGAVSEEIASLMASNVLKLFSSDYGVSVTGIAGPTGGSKLKPVGLVYIGIANKNEINVKKIQFNHNRKGNKIKSSQAVLNWLRINIEDD